MDNSNFNYLSTMFNTQKLLYRLTFAFLSVAITILIVVNLAVYYQTENVIEERTFEQLASVNVLKKRNIEEQIKSRLIKYASLDNKKTSGKDIKIATTEESELILQKVKPKENVNTVADVSKIISKQKILLAYIIRKKDSVHIYLEEPIFINEILKERQGLGLTGESYTVGQDLLLRSPSRFFPQKNPLEIKANTKATTSVFSNNEGSNIIEDYRNIKVLSVYSLLKVGDLHWAILSEIDHDEIIFPVKVIRNKLIVFSIVFLLLLLIIAVFISNRITIPIKYLENIILKLSKGSLPSKINVVSKDEIGNMADAIKLLVKGLQQNIELAKSIGEGNFDSKVELLSNNDELGIALEQMRIQLKQLNDHNNELNKLSKNAIFKGQEEERIRLSKELHDGIGPMLTTIKLKANQLPLDDETLHELDLLISDTIQEVRRVSHNLMPAVLIDYGIAPALKTLIKNINQSSKIKFHYIDDIKPENSKLNPSVNVALYRISQEAINNIIKHSNATEAHITLTEFDESVNLYIADNGKGLLNEEQDGHGLRNIKERVAAFNGDIAFSSADEGTILEVDIPL